MSWSRICGNEPFSSHAVKKNVQSMNGRSSASDGSTTRAPTNGAAATSSARHSIGVRRSIGDPIGSNGSRSRSACCCAQPLLQLAVLRVERGAPLGVEQRRADADHA